MYRLKTSLINSHSSTEKYFGKGAYIKHVGGGPEGFTNFSKYFS